MSLFQKRKLNSCRTDSCPNHGKKGVELKATMSTTGQLYFLCRACDQLLTLMEEQTKRNLLAYQQRLLKPQRRRLSA